MGKSDGCMNNFPSCSQRLGQGQNQGPFGTHASFPSKPNLGNESKERQGLQGYGSHHQSLMHIHTHCTPFLCTHTHAHTQWGGTQM